MRNALTLVAVILGTLPWANASSQGYPTRPIHIIVGTTVGSGIDVASRMLAEKLRESLGQPVVVENKVGADGIVAARHVAASAPDGYTLLLGSNGLMAINPILQDKPPYDPLHDFAPISMIAHYSLVLVVNSTVPVSSVRELAAYAMARPDALNYGSASVTYMYATEGFKKLAGIDLHHIPYSGSPAVVTALLAGDVQVAILNVLATHAPIQSGKLKALAVLNDVREPTLPDVPTLAEAGFRGYDFDIWTAMFAPAGIAPEIAARLQAAIARALKSADLRKRFAAAGLVPVSSTSEFVRELIVRDTKAYTGLVNSLRATAK